MMRNKPSIGQTHQALQVKNTEVRFLLFLPRTYYADVEKMWPLIVFLHGSLERGYDLEMVKKEGIPHKIEAEPDFPFIVISPQCPLARTWEPVLLDAFLGKILETYRINRAQLYCTGLSMGGFGTWEYAFTYPKRFAAIVPICGGGDPAKVKKIRHLPVWVFHGDEDVAVPIKKSFVLVEALKACEGNVRFTVYPGVGHESWRLAYEDPELYSWLLTQKK